MSMTSSHDDNDATLLVSLVLDSLSLGDVGQVKVVARNSLGEADSTAYLFVNG